MGCHKWSTRPKDARLLSAFQRTHGSSYLLNFPSPAHYRCSLKARKNKPTFQLLSAVPAGTAPASCGHCCECHRRGHPAAAGRGSCLLWKQGSTRAARCPDALQELMFNQEWVSRLVSGRCCSAGCLGFLRGLRVLLAVFVQLRFKRHASGPVSVQSCQLH